MMNKKFSSKQRNKSWFVYIGPWRNNEQAIRPNDERIGRWMWEIVAKRGCDSARKNSAWLYVIKESKSLERSILVMILRKFDSPRSESRFESFVLVGDRRAGSKQPEVAIIAPIARSVRPPRPPTFAVRPLALTNRSELLNHRLAHTHS